MARASTISSPRGVPSPLLSRVGNLRMAGFVPNVPRVVQSGLTTVGSLLILILVLGLVGHQAEIHETVVRQTRAKAGTSDWPIICPLPITVDMPNKTAVYNKAQAFQLRIKVLASQRKLSLEQTLLSLRSAFYDDDIVRLQVTVDHFREEEGNEENITVVREKLREAHELLEFVSDFDWPHGPKEVHYRRSNVGSQGQWIEAWWPTSNHEFALILEDDVEVSPQYYRFLRAVVNTYYFDPSNFDPSVYGITLQRPQFVAGRRGNAIQLGNSTRLILYQLVSSWGQLVFPQPWKEFRLWYDRNRALGIKPFLEGLVTTLWYKKYGEKIWIPWFIKFVHSRGYFNLYANLEDEQTLAISRGEMGEAFREAVLLSEPIREQGELWSLPSSKKMPRYNFCFQGTISGPIETFVTWVMPVVVQCVTYVTCDMGDSRVVAQEVVPKRVARTSEDMEIFLASLHTNQTVVLVNAIAMAEALVNNWLCQIAKFTISNYAIVTSDENVALEVSRRGHAAIIVRPMSFDKDGKEEGSSQGRKAGVGLKAQASENVEGSELKGGMVSSMWLEQSLQLEAIISVMHYGYNVVFTTVGTTWLSEPLASVDLEGIDLAGRSAMGSYLLGLLYLRSSKAVENVLTELQTLIWSKEASAPKEEVEGEAVVDMVKKGERDGEREKEEKEDDEGVHGEKESTKGLGSNKKIGLADVETEISENEETLGSPLYKVVVGSKLVLKELEPSILSTIEECAESSASSSSMNGGPPCLIFSHEDMNGGEEIISTLKELKYWNLDEDQACNEVVCHGSRQF